MVAKGIALLEKESGRSALKSACRKARIKVGVIDELVAAELEQVGKRRKRGLWEKFDEILGEISGEEDAD